MSRNKNATSSELINPTLIEASNYRERAKRLKKEHDAWEKKQKFEVIRPDHKTTIYRRVPEGKTVNNKEINKGKI